MGDFEVEKITQALLLDLKPRRELLVCGCASEEKDVHLRIPYGQAVQCDFRS
jgi:hypothetical protein